MMSFYHAHHSSNNFQQVGILISYHLPVIASSSRPKGHLETNSGLLFFSKNLLNQYISTSNSSLFW